MYFAAVSKFSVLSNGNTVTCLQVTLVLPENRLAYSPNRPSFLSW